MTNLSQQKKPLRQPEGATTQTTFQFPTHLSPSGARNAAEGRAAARPLAGGQKAVHLRGRALKRAAVAGQGPCHVSRGFCLSSRKGERPAYPLGKRGGRPA